MKYTSVFLLILWASSISALEVGDPAPEFELPGSDGVLYKLSDFKGKKSVVLAWFPKAYTRGCTIECKSLAENGHLLRQFEVIYFMASVDPIAVNIDFAKRKKADFPLLSDASKATAKDYGVLNKRGLSNRETFYIDKNGLITKIDKDVKPATSAEDMAAALQALNVVKIKR